MPPTFDLPSLGNSDRSNPGKVPAYLKLHQGQNHSQEPLNEDQFENNQNETFVIAKGEAEQPRLTENHLVDADLAKTADEEPSPSLNLLSEAFDQRYQAIVEIVLSQFDREVRLLSRMQFIFALLLGLELTVAFGLFFWLGATLSFAMSLSAIFLTTFASFVTLIYLSTARSHRLIDLRDRFVGSCQQHIGYIEGRLDHHFTLAEMVGRLSSAMSAREYDYIDINIALIRPFVRSFSAWKHWQDVHHFRRLLLESVIDESLALVRAAPLNIEVHAGLANAYVMMAGLFALDTPSSGDENEPTLSFIPIKKMTAEMEESFRYFSSRAVEEFKIISEFAPDDPWVHAQLAYSYHDLKMTQEEIASYEALLNLCPQDDEARFRLGLLYFQQSRNAAGLKMYAILRKRNYPRAHELISFYGRSSLRDLYE